MKDQEGKAGATVKSSAHNAVIFNKNEWVEKNIGFVIIQYNTISFLGSLSTMHKKYPLK